MEAVSNEPGRRWNEANYTQMNVLLPPEIVTGFRAKCAKTGVSMRSEIVRFMSGSTPSKPARMPITTRRERRKAVKTIITLLEEIIAAEAAYAENIPENLKNGAAYDAAEQTVSALEEALSNLVEAY
jgi:hypothetical protein